MELWCYKNLAYWISAPQSTFGSFVALHTKVCLPLIYSVHCSIFQGVFWLHQGSGWEAKCNKLGSQNDVCQPYGRTFQWWG